MNYFRLIFLASGILINLTCHSQNDTILKQGFVNLATLIVDYDTYEFEGGDLSYYSCSNCSNDSLPFEIYYHSPGDFGGILFKIASSSDTVFCASIHWMGTGHIYYPNEFHMGSPFNIINQSIEKPHDIKYMDMDGEVSNETYLIDRADSAWNIIDSLEITKIFSDNGFKVGIYLYPPTVGSFDPSAAKWVIFLYSHNKTSTNDYIDDIGKNISCYPNPTKNIIEISPNNIQTYIKYYKIFNHSGVIIKEEHIGGSNHQIDLTSFPTGLYYIELLDNRGNRIKTEKIIKE